TEFAHRAANGPKDAAEAVAGYRDILSLVGELAAERIAPHSLEIDREGVHFKDGEATFPEKMNAIFEELGALELHGLCLPRDLGGQNCPLTIFYLASELIARADISVMAHNSFHGAMAMAMLVYSVREGTTKFDPANAAILSTRFGSGIEEIRSGKA